MAGFFGCLAFGSEHPGRGDRDYLALKAARFGGPVSVIHSGGASVAVARNAHGPSLSGLAATGAPARRALNTDASPGRTTPIWALCDGRIDGVEELAGALRPVLTRLDTTPGDAAAADLVLAAYLTWGGECPIRLYGDFAFVVWDGPRQRLFCARDPAQSRPLYYHLGRTRFLFSSHLAPLVEEETSGGWDSVHMATYMVHANLNWERTPYAAIRQVPGGGCLTVNPRTGAGEARRWWHLPAPGSLRLRHASEYGERLRDLLHAAVRDRLRTPEGTGPVTVALSRGIDSASVAAAAGNLAQNGRGPSGGVRAVTFSLPGFPEADETEDATWIARRLGLEHAVYAAHPHPREFWRLLHRMNEPSGIAVYWDSWEAVREACVASRSRVVLTGAGGELFDCVFHFAHLARERRYGALLGEMWRWRRGGMPLYRGVQRLIAGLSDPDQSHWGSPQRLERYPWLREPGACWFDFESLRLRHPVVCDNYHNFVEAGRATAGLRPVFDSADIEVRNPLEDRRLVEFAYSLPVRAGLQAEGRNGRLLNKPLLRHAFSPELSLTLPKVSGRLRNYVGRTFYAEWREFEQLLAAPPPGLEAAVDIGVLRRHASDLLRDLGGKRHLALTVGLAQWLRSVAAGSAEGGGPPQDAPQ